MNRVKTRDFFSSTPSNVDFVQANDSASTLGLKSTLVIDYPKEAADAGASPEKRRYADNRVKVVLLPAMFRLESLEPPPLAKDDTSKYSNWSGTDPPSLCTDRQAYIDSLAAIRDSMALAEANGYLLPSPSSSHQYQTEVKIGAMQVCDTPRQS